MIELPVDMQAAAPLLLGNVASGIGLFEQLGRRGVRVFDQHNSHAYPDLKGRFGPMKIVFLYACLELIRGADAVFLAAVLHK